MFNSFSYAVFLPVVFALYWALPHAYRWALLLAADCCFYVSANPASIVPILFISAVSYTAGRLIENCAGQRARKRIAAANAVLCLGVLFFFKYFDFASRTFSDMLGLFRVETDPIVLNLLLPAGISFYTFQAVGYVIDVCRGDVPAERHFGYYALFISFFPKLTAGPIERSAHLLPQLRAEHTFDYRQASYGLKLMAWGYFKKIVIADTLAQYADAVFGAPRNFSGFALVLAVLCFTVQIYCDFSGYSDIAVGTAKLFGIDLMTNFRSPYFSQSVKEFWGHWHISLSTWFRDYIYIPLGGNRVGKLRHAWNLLVTFLISGLWHGADWTFVVWGGIHGAAQILENSLLPKGRRESTGSLRWLRVGAVFLFSAFTWVFFASNSLSDAVYVLTHLFTGITRPASYILNGFTDLGIDSASVILQDLGLVLLVAVYDYASLHMNVIAAVSGMKKGLRWTVYVLLVLLIVFLSQKGISAAFVYAQF